MDIIYILLRRVTALQDNFKVLIFVAFLGIFYYAIIYFLIIFSMTELSEKADSPEYVSI